MKMWVLRVSSEDLTPQSESGSRIQFWFVFLTGELSRIRTLGPAPETSSPAPRWTGPPGSTHPPCLRFLRLEAGAGWSWAGPTAAVWAAWLRPPQTGGSMRPPPGAAGSSLRSVLFLHLDSVWGCCQFVTIFKIRRSGCFYSTASVFSQSWNKRSESPFLNHIYSVLLGSFVFRVLKNRNIKMNEITAVNL